jgi:N-succinyldiaminopimelate aminotransferase
VNPNLDKLQPYPFEKLRQLFQGLPAPAGLREIRLSIGEPQHDAGLHQGSAGRQPRGLANYPTTSGLSDALRQAIAAWLARRYGIPAPDAGSTRCCR